MLWYWELLSGSCWFMAVERLFVFLQPCFSSVGLRSLVAYTVNIVLFWDFYRARVTVCDLEE